ncbi:MAG: hypothetical protein HY677_04365 [Chloroflexi bacterium]|nr:hypothetical protein [Chloroflexota bacterium]
MAIDRRHPGDRPALATLLSLAIAVFTVVVLFTKGSRPEPPSVTLPVQSVAIVLPANRWSDGALSLAAQDLSAAVASLYGVTVVTSPANIALDLPPYSVLIAEADDPLLRDLSPGLPPLQPEAYAVRRLDVDGGPLIVVAGGGPLGAAYGAFNFIERLRLDPRLILSSFAFNAAPAMELRLVSDPLDPDYPSPEQALRWGFNAIAVQPWPSLALYDGVDPAIYSPQEHAAGRAWVLEQRRRAQERIAAAMRLHLRVVSSGDVLSFPRQVLDLFGTRVFDGQDPPHFCIQQPLTKRLLAGALDEVLRAFPGIDAVMVRTGENYPSGPIIGSRPGGCGGDPWVDLRQVIDVVRQEVVERHGRTFIQRAWDLGPDGMHADPSVAARVLNGIAPDPRFIVSFKQTQTDFWRYNSLNPSLGQGPFSRMIELQAAREYEGKGAFPNYLGSVYAAGDPLSQEPGGLRQAYERGVRAVWVWAKGGGWGGPVPASNLWVDANVYALRRLSWDASANPGVIVSDWATLNFGAEAAPYVASLLMKSADAAAKAFYLAPAARAKGHGWAPNDLWVRDDAIYGGDQLRPLYARSSDDASFAEALAEKNEAIALVDAMLDDLARARRLAPHTPAVAFAEGSLLYERALLEVVRDYMAGMFHYFRWQDAPTEAHRRLAQDHLRRWQGSWRRYIEEAARLDVATPYQDRGMGQAVAGALVELGR